MWLQYKSSQSFVKYWEDLQVLQESVCIDLKTTTSSGRTDRAQAFQNNSTHLRLVIHGSMNWPSKLSNGSLSHKLAFRRPNCDWRGFHSNKWRRCSWKSLSVVKMETGMLYLAAHSPAVQKDGKKLYDLKNLISCEKQRDDGTVIKKQKIKKWFISLLQEYLNCLNLKCKASIQTDKCKLEGTLESIKTSECMLNDGQQMIMLWPSEEKI